MVSVPAGSMLPADPIWFIWHNYLSVYLSGATAETLLHFFVFVFCTSVAVVGKCLCVYDCRISSVDRQDSHNAILAAESSPVPGSITGDFYVCVRFCCLHLLCSFLHACVSYYLCCRFNLFLVIPPVLPVEWWRHVHISKEALCTCVVLPSRKHGWGKPSVGLINSATLHQWKCLHQIQPGSHSRTFHTCMIYRSFFWR